MMSVSAPLYALMVWSVKPDCLISRRSNSLFLTFLKRWHILPAGKKRRRSLSNAYLHTLFARRKSCAVTQNCTKFDEWSLSIMILNTSVTSGATTCDPREQWHQQDIQCSHHNEIKFCVIRTENKLMAKQRPEDTLSTTSQSLHHSLHCPRCIQHHLQNSSLVTI